MQSTHRPSRTFGWQLPAIARSALAATDRRWLAGLLAADFALIMLHLGQRAFWPQHRLLSLVEDRGCAEWFQYAQALLVAACCAFAWRKRRNPLMLWWSVLFVYLAADDAFRLHESVGIWLTDNLRLFSAAGALGHATGELAWFASVGASWLGAYVWTAARWPEARTDAAQQQLWLLFGVLVAFGAGADFATSVGELYGLRGLGLIEEGGRLLAMSLLGAWAVGHAARAADRQPPPEAPARAAQPAARNPDTSTPTDSQSG